jgi:tetratricopeptide (TPR) repeat protein
LASRQKLAGSEPDNVEAQRILSVSYNKVGDALQETGKNADALAAFQRALAIRQKLADAQPANTQRLLDVSFNYERVGGALAAAGRRDDALVQYRRDLALHRSSPPATRGMRSGRATCSSDRPDRRLAYRFVLAREFAKAMEVADQAIAPRAARDLALHQSRACADPRRADQARALSTVPQREERPGRQVLVALVQEDFAELRKAG